MPAAALHVGDDAAAPPAALLHVKVAVSTAPGPALAGRPLMAAAMSDAGPTTMLAVAVSQAAGVVAGLAQIW